MTEIGAIAVGQAATGRALFALGSTGASPSDHVSICVDSD